MRERLAKALAALLTGFVVLLAAFFAHRRNEAGPPSPLPPPEPQPEAVQPEAVQPLPVEDALVARGLAVYEEQACGRCHSVDGRGNPRSPLDGVGARLTRDALRDAVTASGSTREALTRSVIRAKEGFGGLPEQDLSALVAYLSSLR
jgi:mono/diheme cytochrome c family protein